MISFRTVLLAAAGMVSALVVAPAFAQQSKDTLRLATREHFSSLDYYHDPGSETGQFVRHMYGWLLIYDERKRKFVPELAKSWKRINQTTLEFELRDDIIYHTGNKFTAEDVRHTIHYLIGPKLKIRFKGRYKWIKEVQVINPHKIRIVSRKPFSTDLHTLAYRIYFYDSKVHKELKNKKDYGRLSASTTGVYKAVSIDRNKGFLVERFEPAVGKFAHRPAPIKRIQTVPIPDPQAQLASIMTGAVDVVRNIDADQMRDLARSKDIKLTPVRAKQIIYIVLDALGRSKVKAFKDKRVRQAFFKAIPREALRKIVVPAVEIADLPKSICFKANVACDPSTDVLGYDPEGAKKLLAEAGYANGIDFPMITSSTVTATAHAVAGELRKVGLRAEVQAGPRYMTTKRRAKGEASTYFASYPTFGQPTTTNLMNFFFAGNRNYNGDPAIKKARKMGATEFDLAKRTAIYRKAMDLVNSENYIYAFSELPVVFGHRKNVVANPNPTTIMDLHIGDWSWKK